jgi:two-component system NtrC family response regulator
MSHEKIRLLIVDDEVRFIETLSRRLGLRDFDVTAVTSPKEALRTAEQQEFDLAIVDLKMPEMSGERLLEILKQRAPLIEVVMLTGHGSIDSAVTCTKLGAFCYLQKPCETDELLRVLREAYQKRVESRVRADVERMGEFARIATEQSPLAALRRLRELEKQGT